MNDEIHTSLINSGFSPISLIGRGSYGCVFKVSWDRYPKQIFAAKIINLQQGVSEGLKRSFYQEIESLRRLCHPNIIYIYKYFEISYYLVMILEYCPFGTLKDYIKENGPMKPSSFLQVTKQCLEALRLCHSKNISHLDIKPENIMIGNNYKIKLADFGLSILLKDNDRVNLFQGSEMFFSPERFMSSAYDPKKVDVWALGMTFFILYYGKKPWQFESEEELINAIQNEGIYVEDIEYHDIKQLLYRMLEKDPDYRLSCEQLLNIRMFKEGLGEETDIDSLSVPRAASLVTKHLPSLKPLRPQNPNMPISFVNTAKNNILRSRSFKPKRPDIALISPPK